MRYSPNRSGKSEEMPYVRIHVSKFSNGGTIINFEKIGQPVSIKNCDAESDLVSNVQYLCYDPENILPRHGFLVVQDFELWKRDLDFHGISMTEESPSTGTIEVNS